MLNFLAFGAVLLLGAVMQLVGLWVDQKIFIKYGKEKQRQYRFCMIGLVLFLLVILSFLLFDVANTIK